ncbi:MAG: ribbon-helix-helix domain-containing protein [Candidatus Cloacimonetes bacterium]|nr:ribbon-helix-helix domain-containing protein [Candidatus Cloacimonadota bacterium]
MAKNIMSFNLDNNLVNFLDKYSKELQVSKSWIVKQALQQYFDKFDEYLSDLRIASLSEEKSHEEILEEYDFLNHLE